MKFLAVVYFASFALTLIRHCIVTGWSRRGPRLSTPKAPLFCAGKAPRRRKDQIRRSASSRRRCCFAACIIEPRSTISLLYMYGNI